MATAKTTSTKVNGSDKGAAVKLVFYDLEWTQNEIIQIGAVCGNADFSQSIRPSGKIDPFVRKKIKLDVRRDPSGYMQVYDMVRKQFLPTVDPRRGFENFLSWLEIVSGGCPLYLVSHGVNDILVLDRNLAKFDLDQRLYGVVSKYIDFQKYLTLHFKDISRMSLMELVKIFCNSQIFRLHCADEDSKALMSVFTNMHQMRGVGSEEYMRNITRMKKVYIKSVTIPKNTKEIKEIANHLNPGSKYVLLPSIFGVYNIFIASPLFRIIEHPENFKFEVSGYCVSQRSERYNPKKDDDTKLRTRIDLACHIGNAYFILIHYIASGAKSPFNIVKQEGSGKRVVLESGTPVSVMVLVTSTNYVKVDSLSVNHEKKPVDINKILTDLQKKQAHLVGQKKEDNWGSLSSGLDSESSRSKSFPSQSNNNNNGNNSVKTQGRPLIRSRKGDQDPPPAAAVDFETDLTILMRRQKQIEYCKRTDDYKIYAREIPRQSRSFTMPKTPDMNRKYSRRQWDGAVKRWKTQVHSTGRDLASAHSSSSSSGSNQSLPKENTNPNSNQ